MCGIIFLLQDENNQFQPSKLLNQLIDQRGPDYQSDLEEHVTRCKIKLKFKASVLHLRGETLKKQPVIDKLGNITLFNGQIYKFNNQELNCRSSDTSFLADKLANCESKDDIVKVIAMIDGPFAFVFWHNNMNILFYGRDIFGRKSLCKFASNTLHPTIISSCCDQDLSLNNPSLNNLSWFEVQSGQVHCIEFKDDLSYPRQYVYPLDLDEVYQPTAKCIITNIDHFQVMPPHTIKNLLKPLNRDSESTTTEVLHHMMELKEKLMSAISTRINYRQQCLNCRKISNLTCDHSKLAVAFSGGIDSTLLALLIDAVYPKTESIDLITVAFKNNSPDRLSTDIAFKELRKLCPDRRWKLVACDITIGRLKNERSKFIRHLIAPCSTVIDDSVGCACWFIGEGKGRLLEDLEDLSIDKFLQFSLDNQEFQKGSSEYISPASMLFVGSGIDEQLGGYSSHRSAWVRSKHDGVLDEISFLMRRISSRNMGRDDRVYSHHGRDVKIPYLDYNVVSFLNELPLCTKMDLEEPTSSGPKKLLRSLAHHLGLEETSKQVKRALQFGTRIANLEDSNEKGHQVCSRLMINRVPSN